MLVFYSQHKEATVKRDKAVVCFTDDANFILYMPEYPATRTQVSNYIRRLAGKIDILTWDCLVNGVCWYWSDVGPNIFEGRDDYRDFSGKLLAENIKTLAESGANPPLSVAEECHRRGITMLASVRMGLSMYDPKECGIYYNARMTPQFHNMTIKNLDLSLEARANRIANSARNLDFSYPEVRDLILKPCEKLVAEFPIDGLHLNFIRGGAPFESHEAAAKAPIMTELLRELVDMLRKGAQKRTTEKLILAVRVPNDLHYCAQAGLDVKTWVTEGLVDVIIPDQIHTMIFDARIDEFAETCKGTEVLVLPSLHPCSEPLEPKALFRAGVDNWYRQGADGFSTFNFFFFHQYDGFSLDWFDEFRNPELVSSQKRIFPMQAHTEQRFDLYNINEAEVRFRKHETGIRKTVRFPRILALENPSLKDDNNITAVLEFKVQDWSWEDELAIDIDGITLNDIKQSYSVNPHFTELTSDSPNVTTTFEPQIMESYEWNTYDFKVVLTTSTDTRHFREIGFTLVKRSNILSDVLIKKIRVILSVL